MHLIDTHVHIWDLENLRYTWLEGNTTLLNRTYRIEELAEPRVEAGVTGGVLVQAANTFEDTDLMLETAAQTDWIEGVVGWVPLLDPRQTEQALERYLQHPYFKGVRHLIHDEPDPQWLLQPTVLESLQLLADRNVPYDVVGVLPEHIETALQVAEKIPSLRMVFDHLNQPPIATGETYGRWGELMQEAAQHDGFYAKISGLGTTSGKLYDWTADDLEPYVAFAIEHFGTERCFCGGDWPVSLLAESYVHTWQAYQQLLQSLLDEAAQAQVFHLNARQFYRL
ncbi:L-fuconolactonase [Catalinimonas alkaloidigena]|uniref:L-fuconolactonase n=1 Tax=Catalinimonas alkaloidigena TaxID=1075417 RepID=A0A1G9M0X1_9BACT|nr:amidohydrolase family protein [Catalinimonas alkaloidigena]SDL67375.1 L-fuconolactonase [Catalinimonas alkaloidigena]